MTKNVKVALIVAGYVAAAIVASIAVSIRISMTNGPMEQAESGMYAAGDMFLFIFVFGLLALAPTGAALFLLRQVRTLWTVLSVAAIAVAATGLTEFVLYVASHDAGGPSIVVTLAALAPLRLIIAPLIALVFLLSAMIAPYRSPRLALLSAALVEAGVTIATAILWFNPFGPS